MFVLPALLYITAFQILWFYDNQKEEFCKNIENWNCWLREAAYSSIEGEGG